MRKIRELLRLKFELGLSDRKVALSLSMSRSAVGECLARLSRAGIVWPVPSELTDEGLEQRLYPTRPLAVDIPPGRTSPMFTGSCPVPA